MDTMINKHLFLMICSLALNVALTIYAVRLRSAMATQVRAEVQRQLDEREAQLVARLQPGANRILSDMGQPEKSFTNFSEIIWTFGEVFSKIGQLPGTSTNPASPPNLQPR